MKTFYATTPIYYVNDLPHIGHIYSTVVTDALTRYRRLIGEKTRFLTGTDEHGQNIEKAAAAQGIAPIELANRVVERYHQLYETFEIENDDFIRTTEPRHRRGVEALIAKIAAAGDFYTARHEGWYCSSCEAFYTEKELDAERRCPVHGRPTAWESEENVFFRLSKYAEPLLAHYAAHPEFVRPETRLAEVVSFVRSGLNDLSVSRSKVKWGIPFPGHPGHVVYVWLDALANYITALGYGASDDRLYREFWAHEDAERVHVIGKDILRFHAVYWPAFLLSAGEPLPTTVWAHGWWLRDAKKVSKSVGNIVRPDNLVADFGADALRYFLLREMAFGQDASFSDEAFLTRYNADLANDLGNTVSRVASLCRQSFGATPREVCNDNEVLAAFSEVERDWRAAMADCQFHRAIEAVWKLLTAVNGYVVAKEPWKIRKAEGSGSDRLHRILSAAAEGVRLSAVMLSPFIPASSRRIFAAFGLPAEDPRPEDLAWGRLPVSTALAETPPLFPRADADAYFERKDTAMSSNTPTPGGEPPAALTAPAVDESITIDDFRRIRLRTARILEAERVPKSNKLMRLQVDVGGERRQIVAGIAAQYEPAALVGRNVVVVANLKPAKLMGVESNGMVLAASVGDDGRPVLLDVPSDVPSGSIVK
ncbi:MAG TPA: methionine--tRNA ligase [Thermoanaerobaculia bacterium]|nr:methionine--tRNA ligase [Thermoanaerobaculia bacterium]